MPALFNHTNRVRSSEDRSLATPVHQTLRLAGMLSVFWGTWVCPLTHAQTEIYRVSGFSSPEPIESGSSVTVTSTAGTASATPGQLSVNASASATSFLDGRSTGISGGGNASYSNTRFLLDPIGVGALGLVHVTGSVGVSANGSVAIDPSGFAASNGASAGASALTASGALAEVSGSSDSESPASMAQSFSETLTLQAGSAFTLSANANANADANYYGLGGGSSSGAAALISFSIELQEDRLHWDTTDQVIHANVASQWAENLAINASRYVVFNAEAARTLSLVLESNQTWRGLNVDGEDLTLDLGARTLTLGSEGPSSKSTNILVGEARGGASKLTLRNGSVSIAHDVIIGIDAANPGTLVLENSARLTEILNSGTSTVVGLRGAGSLTVRGASMLDVSALVLGGSMGSNGAGDVTGAGSSINAIGVIVGKAGQGSLTVQEGGLLEANHLSIGNDAGAVGSISVDGLGSRLAMLPVTNSAVYIGATTGSRGTLEVKNGASLLGEAIAFTVGAGRPEDDSLFRATGTGTVIADVGLNVLAGGRFELNHRATWSGGGLVVRGGVALLNDQATANLNNQILIGSKTEGDLVVAPGRLDIANGAVLNVTQRVDVERGAVLSVEGAGSHLNGFSSLFLNGALAIGNGGRVTAADGPGGPGQIVVQEHGVITGNMGAIDANLFFTQNAKFKPGNSPGTMTINGNLSMASGARLELEIGGLTAGSLYDFLVVNGDVEIEPGAIVEFAFVNGFAPVNGETFNFFSVSDGFDFTSGTTRFEVSGLEPGWYYEVAGGESGFALISRSDGVASSAVPEPSAYGMVLGLLACGVVAGRGRFRSGRK